MIYGSLAIQRKTSVMSVRESRKAVAGSGVPFLTGRNPGTTLRRASSQAASETGLDAGVVFNP